MTQREQGIILVAVGALGMIIPALVTGKLVHLAAFLPLLALLGRAVTAETSIGFMVIN